MEADFAAIRDGLRRLRDSAASLKVFGSIAHAFQTNPPLSEESVRMFEGRHRVILPKEYSGFLVRVGNGGAGPAYGLFKLGDMDAMNGYEQWTEDNGFVGVLSKPFPHARPWNDLSEKPEFDESQEHSLDEEDEYGRQMDAWERRIYWNTTHVNGAVPICHRGCALRQWLVVTGPEAGHVWDDDRTDYGGLKPVQSKGERVGFLQWYRSWLDEGLRQL
ncbi:MAG TPA: hypothetical protein DDY78_19100 [Planctomycetales bacterium]|jgi:hypothetical protein|nr:hypothetical protein [Planctomycetales bacterium]